MDASDPVERQPKPKLFLYSLVLPVVWMTVGTILSEAAPNFRLGIAGTTFFFMLICVGISWIFLKRHGRMPANTESWRLIAYCSALAILMETWVLLAALTWPELFPDIQITKDIVIFAIGFAAVLDTVIIALGFKVVAPRYLKKLMPNTEYP